MTREEATICRIFLEDVARKYKNCEEYKLLMDAVNTEPCEDDEVLVRKNDVLRTFFKYGPFVFSSQQHDYHAMQTEMANLPSVKPEAKTGKWTRGFGNTSCTCWKCGGNGEPHYLFCHWCGAKMESEDKE